MSRLLLLAAAVGGALLAAPASAANLEVISGSGQRAVTIASADPIGQSFVALDSTLTSFGFQFNALNPTNSNDPITFTLLAGETLTGTALFTTSFTLPTTINSRTPTWFDIAVGTGLTIGQTYTAVLTTGGSFRNALVYGPDINLNTGQALGPDAYAGGRLLFTGSVGGAICAGATSICDANFRFSGTTAAAAVPEPASWAMMIGGFGLVGGAMRRRRRTVAFA